MTYFFGGAHVCAQRGKIKENEADLEDMVYRRQLVKCGRNGDRCRVSHGVPVGACRNCGESQRLDTMLISQADRLTMATGQRFSFIPISAAIDWTHGMDNV